MKRTKEQDRRETNLKARMAQSLVADLLLESGNDVYPIGHQSVLPQTLAIEDMLERHPEIGIKLRAIPDFLVVGSKGKPYLIDVKFRWHPDGHENDIKKLRKLGELWQETLIVFVNCSEKPYFRISHAPFISKQGNIITAPLQSMNELRISDTLIEKFNELVVKYLTPTLFPSNN